MSGAGAWWRSAAPSRAAFFTGSGVFRGPKNRSLYAPAMSSQFGHAFRISTWGESHGGGVGVVVDGCPPRIALSEADIQRDLDRRRPGQSSIVTPRDEADRC